MLLDPDLAFQPGLCIVIIILLLYDKRFSLRDRGLTYLWHPEDVL